jgi:hypothetical protein
MALLLAATALRGCASYEYEHEIWLRVDGSGTVNVTGRPALWTAFKSLPLDPQGDPDELKRKASELFARSGLSVKRVTLTTRRGQRYLFVSADLRVGVRREGGRLILDGSWQRPLDALAGGEHDREGLMAVRFHLPSKVYGHKNAAFGVERGNILGWPQETAAALDGGRLEFGAEMDERSILSSTVMLFVGAVVLAVLLLAAALWAVVRRGRRDLARSGGSPPRPGAV